MAEKCTKLISALSKSAKLNWGLNHKALMTIYTEGILPLLLYGTPVWKKTIDKVSYKSKLVRVQRLINKRIVKAYNKVSNEDLCIITGLNSIAIKIEEAFQFCQLTRGSKKDDALVNRDMELKYWHHPAEMMNYFREDIDGTSTIQIFTDGSKSEKGVGAGVPIFKLGDHITYLLTPWSRVLLEKLTGFAAKQDILRILSNPKVHYHTHKRPPLCGYLLTYSMEQSPS